MSSIESSPTGEHAIAKAKKIPAQIELARHVSHNLFTMPAMKPTRKVASLTVPSVPKTAMKTQISPKEFGEATGVSESSVKRWIDNGLIEASRTAGGHRRITLDEAVRYIREHRLTVIKPQVLGLRDLMSTASVADDTQLAHRSLSLALQSGLASQVRGIILSLYLGGHSIAAIADGPIASAMHEIGELWKSSKAGIFVEHRATDLCMQAVSQLRGLLPPADELAPIAIGTAPSDDPYLLPTMLASVTLSADGWHAINLGPQMPLDVFAQSAKENNAELAWLSITSPQTDGVLTRDVETLAQQLNDYGTTLIIGGQQLPRPFRIAAPNLHIAYTMAELAAFARGLRQSLASPQDSDTTIAAQRR